MNRPFGPLVTDTPPLCTRVLAGALDVLLRHLLTVTGPGVNMTYTYDGFGHRFAKTDNTQNPAVTTFFIWDENGRDTDELDVNGNVLREFVYDGVHLAPVQILTFQNNTVGNTTFNHFDRAGSVMLITDPNGQTLSQYAYLPFGDSNPPNISGCSGAGTSASTCGSGTGTTFGYDGYRYDAETGLYYTGARYYDPRLGRFLTPDPIGQAGGINLYAYVGNDPLNALDPSGLWSSQAVADYLNGSANKMDVASAFFVAQPVVPFKLLGPVYSASSVLFKSVASYVQPDLTGTVIDAAADVVSDSLPIPGVLKPLASQSLSIAGNGLVSLGDSMVSNQSAGNQAPTTGLYINPSVLTDPTSLTGPQRPLSSDGGKS